MASAIMRGSKAVCLVLALLSGRALAAESPKPSQCAAETGKWRHWEINCDFTCQGAGWELNCDCTPDRCATVRCKVDKDGAPDSEDIKFECPVPAENKPPKCTLPGMSNSCVMDTVKAVLAAWAVAPNPNAPKPSTGK